MCMYCKDTKYVQSTTPHVVTYQNCVIVIRNVPCLECDRCGERHYTDDVAEKIETIVAATKKLMQELAVVDYRSISV